LIEVLLAYRLTVIYIAVVVSVLVILELRG
jgi:hypothetical protein